MDYSLQRLPTLWLEIGRKTSEIFYGFIIGKIIDSIVIGIICAIFMKIVGLPYILLCSVVIGVTNIIPCIWTILWCGSKQLLFCSLQIPHRNHFLDICYSFTADRWKYYRACHTGRFHRIISILGSGCNRCRWRTLWCSRNDCRRAYYGIALLSRW